MIQIFDEPLHEQSELSSNDNTLTSKVSREVLGPPGPHWPNMGQAAMARCLRSPMHLCRRRLGQSLWPCCRRPLPSRTISSRPSWTVRSGARVMPPCLTRRCCAAAALISLFFFAPLSSSFGSDDGPFAAHRAQKVGQGHGCPHKLCHIRLPWWTGSQVGQGPRFLLCFCPPSSPAADAPSSCRRPQRGIPVYAKRGRKAVDHCPQCYCQQRSSCRRGAGEVPRAPAYCTRV